MSDVDLDAILAEEAEWTNVRFRGRDWKFGSVQDIPLRMLERDPQSDAEDAELTRSILCAVVEPGQRDDFADLDLSLRELGALARVLYTTQQGADLGESEASPLSSDIES